MNIPLNRKMRRQIKAVASIEQRIIKAAEVGNINEVKRQVQFAKDIRRKLNQPAIEVNDYMLYRNILEVYIRFADDDYEYLWPRS